METLDKGIILSRNDYNQFDQIITVLFEKSGIKTLIALGTLRPKSKNSSHIQLGNYSDVSFFKARLNNISKLKKAITIKNFSQIKESINMFSIMTYILEISKNILEEKWEINTAKWHYFLLKILDMISKDYFVAIIKFSQYALNEMGIKTINDKCGECHSRNNISYINHSYQGLVCYFCFNKSYSKELVLDFISITNWNFDNELKITNTNKILICNFYVEWISSFVLVSKNILKSVKLIRI